jgi:hypothetical protein
MEGFEFIILTEKSASFYGVFIEITEDILKMSSIKVYGISIIIKRTTLHIFKYLNPKKKFCYRI